MCAPAASRSLASAFLSATLALICCCGTARAATTVRVGGNGSGLPTMKLLAHLYQKAHPDVAITVLPNLGSSGGIQALRKGALDIAISTRALKADEQSAGLLAVEYARTPFVFATHPKVAKSGLTEYELIGLLHQDSPQWPDGTRVRLIMRPENDSDTSLIRQISPEVERGLKRAYARPGMVQAVTDQDCLDAIVKMPGALGGAALSEIITERRTARPLTYNGVAPTLKNLANGTYPLVKRYYLVTGQKTSPAVDDFATFVRSSKARELLKKAGNLPVPDAKER